MVPQTANPVTSAQIARAHQLRAEAFLTFARALGRDLARAFRAFDRGVDTYSSGR